MVKQERTTAFMLIDEQTGKHYYRSTEKSAEQLQTDKAINGIDLTLYKWDDVTNSYVLW